MADIEEEVDPILEAIDAAVASELPDETEASEGNDGTTVTQVQGQDPAKQSTDPQGTQVNPNAQPQGQDQDAGGPQDLTDHLGNMIARGGAERRIYERNAVGRAVQLEGEVRQLKGTVETYERANAIGSQLGLNPGEVAVGAQLIDGLKRDPINTVKNLLTELQSKGHNIEDLGGVNVGAITSAIQEQIRPLVERFQQSENVTRARADAETQYTNFMTAHADARIHEDSLAYLLQERQRAGQPITLDEAYLTLRNYYYEKQLPWDKPLSAFTNGNPGGSNTPNPANLPSGRGNAQSGSVVPQVPNMAGESDEWDDIIGDVVANDQSL
jgi:hypothetical protein